MKYGKDGGAESRVWGFWLVEINCLFSIVLLRFEDGSREAYHSHAFNAVSWVLGGMLVERHLNAGADCHEPGWRPVVTRRDTFHKVTSVGRTWVLSFRGPWCKTWREYLPATDEVVTLSNGRRIEAYEKLPRSSDFESSRAADFRAAWPEIAARRS